MYQIVLSVVTGIVAWWLVYHGFRPRIRWDDYVEERASGYDWHPAPVYSVGFVNVGYRSAVEINTHARLRIKGVVPGRPNRWLVIEIPTNNQLIPLALSTKRSLAWPLIQRPPVMRRVIVLHITELRKGDLRRLPTHLADALAAGTAGLSDLMRLGTDADLTMAAICSDSFSGARRASLSTALKLLDIKNLEPKEG